MGVFTMALGGGAVGREASVATIPGVRSIFDHYSSDRYATAYPNIRAIAGDYMQVRPFAIDSNGKPVKHQIVDALYHPNQLDSSVAFAEKVAVSTLSHRKTYILVWRREGAEAKPGGNFRTDTIAGFTFLEFPSVRREGGKTVYGVGSQQYSEDEVIVLPGGVDPSNLYSGYSPSEAARRWATLDDYIADFQSGFFENGGVPAGQFIITAPSVKDFNDMADRLEARHMGAGNNNRVTYTHRPIDLKSGKPVDAQIEWVPFSQPNKDIDFEHLFEQTNRRLDTAFGVSQIIKGVDSEAKYSNAQVAEKNFAKRVVYPLLLRNYTQLNHELNRITGGTGISITFKYDIPTVADEEKVEAETHSINVSTLIALEAAGYNLDSVVDALNLPTSYKLLKKGEQSTVIDNDKPDVDEGDEVEKSPDPRKANDPLMGAAKRKNPKAQAEQPEMTPEECEELLYSAAQGYMQWQIDRAIEQSRKGAEDTVDEEEQREDSFVDELLLIIVALMIVRGAIHMDEGRQMLADAGQSVDGLTAFVLAVETQQAYRHYLTNVARSYGQKTGSAIRKVLDHGAAHGWSQAELEKNLKDIADIDDWRIRRLARTETARADAVSSVEALKQAQAQAGVLIEKTLESGSGNPCEFCRSLIGKWVPVDQALIPLNGIVVGADGGIFINDFAENVGYDPHPNGHCHPKYRVVDSYSARAESTAGDIDLRCEKCNRFLNITSTHSMIAQVRCSNAKCKHINNVKVVRASTSSDEDVRYCFHDH